MRLPVEDEHLHSTFAMEELRSFIQAMRHDALMSWFRRSFGEKLPQSAFLQLRSAVLARLVPQPRIVLVHEGVQGHRAAYDRKESTILIERGLVRRARHHNDDAWLLLVCLTEEFGHHLDNLLRTHYSKMGGDAPLDEGARVAYTLVNFCGRQQRPCTRFAKYVTAEGEVSLEVKLSGRTAAVRQYLNSTEQVVDAKSGDLEFFGAGRGTEGKRGSYGHESIEEALESVNFTVQEREWVYFGNWLRDYSQLVDPKVTRKKGSSVLNGFSREAITGIVDILAQLHFGKDPYGSSSFTNFRVTPSMLGVYRNEEHIDNPCGIKNAKDIDPDFRGACLPVELAVNTHLRMKNFIRSGELIDERAPRSHQVKDGDSLVSLGLANGLTWQELARYNFGTDVPAEVSRHLYDKVGCRKRTFDGHNYVFTSKDQPGIIQIPGSAGRLGPEEPYTAFRYLSDQLRLAVRKNKTPEGLRTFGNALHTLEDFFSHTNFVELALIHLGVWVEPWVPVNGARAGHAHSLALTSGKFGGLDTCASLMMGLVKVLEKAQECAAGKPTAATKIALIILKDRGYDEVHANLSDLLKHIHELEAKYPWLATLSCKLFIKFKRWAKFELGKVIHEMVGYIDDVQTAFLEDLNSGNPTHTQLAKDHDEHPLHELAARLAAGAVKDVGAVMKQAWGGKASTEDVVLTASRYFHHPTQVDAGGRAGWMLEEVRKWMQNPANKSAISRLGSRAWVQHQRNAFSEHLRELRKTADELRRLK
jgi:hypothetical protein